MARYVTFCDPKPSGPGSGPILRPVPEVVFDLYGTYADKNYSFGVRRKNLRTPSYAYLRICIFSKVICDFFSPETNTQIPVVVKKDKYKSAAQPILVIQIFLQA